MSALDALPPDQRAVVALLLRRGGSYDEVADVLGLPVGGVRARAHAGLAALGPGDGLPPEVTGPLADYLLGQQSPPDAEATRGLLAESAPARAWAAGVARAIAPDAPNRLPEVPGDEGAGVAAGDESPAVAAGDEGASHDAVAAGDEGASHDAVAAGDDRAGAAVRDEGAAVAARDEGAAVAVRDEGAAVAAGDEAVAAPAAVERPRPAGPPQSSRLGGIVLIAGVLGVVAIALVLVFRGGDDEEPASNAAVATATPTPTPSTARITDQIALRPVDDSGARGRMTVFLQDNRLFFQLRATDVPPTADGAAYAVWFTGPGTRARRLGYTPPVGENGELGIEGPSDKDAGRFPQLYATYANVVVSRERDPEAERPGDPVLRGLLPTGR